MNRKTNVCKRLFFFLLLGILAVFPPETQLAEAAATNSSKSIRLDTPYLARPQSSYNSITLNWFPVDDARGYRIYRKTNSGSWKAIKTTSHTTFVDKDVRAGYTYTYTVKAYKKVNGKNVYSSYNKKGQSAKLTTTINTITDTHMGSVKLSWKQTRGASGYYLYRATGYSGKYSRIKTISGGSTLSYENSGLKDGQTYSYKVTPYAKVNGKNVIGSSSRVQSITTEHAEKLQFGTFISSPQINNIGDNYRLHVNNDIKDVVLSQQDVIVLSEKKESDYWIFTALNPGEVTLTVMDIYNQVLSVDITVEQTLKYKNQTIKLTSSHFDSSIAAPNVIKYGFSNVSVDARCLKQYPGSDSYMGYEAHLSQTPAFDNFSYDEDDDSNDFNYLYFGGLKSGGTYYMRIRFFTYEGNTKIYGHWTPAKEISTVNATQPNPDNKAKYSYKAYFLDSYGPEVYVGCERVIFIQTDNPERDSFNVYGASFVGHGPSYDDIRYLDPADPDSNYRESLEKVDGGYIAYLYFETPGVRNIEIRELSTKGYIVANKFRLNVLDYKTEANKWIDKIISEHTTSNMTPFEKMDAVCRYLNTPGLFRYLTNDGHILLDLASMPNSPWFKSYRWDSFTSPAVLCMIAEHIGGFDDIHNCYYDREDWANNHYYAKLTIGSETRKYEACPYSSTGIIGSINYIDFRNTSRMLLLK